MVPQTPWLERRFDFNYPVGMFPVIIERLRGTIPRLESLVKDFPEETLSEKQGSSWSVKEQAGHLYDLEPLWMGRIDDFMSGKSTLRAADMTNQKTHTANHNLKPMSELLAQFKEARMKLVRKVEDIDEATALLTALHPRLNKQIRLIDSLFFVAEHDDHHLAKTRQLLVFYDS